MTDIRYSEVRTIVIASPDARMRAHCVAQLAQRGRNVVSSADFKAPGITDRIRPAALLAVAESLLPDDASHWREILEDHGWVGTIVILGAPGSTVDLRATDLVYLPAPFDIESLLAQM